MVETTIHRYRTGIASRDSPEVFGPWQTGAGSASSDGERRRPGHSVCEYTVAAHEAGLVVWALSVDPTFARAHQHASAPARDGHHSGPGSNDTNPRIKPPDRDIGRSPGDLQSKIHQLVDSTGLPL